jgi:hypothetical protein
MFYEVRTYTLRPGTVAEFEERYAKRLPLREKHSKLGAFWHTEFGPLNQVIHVYPYEDFRQRAAVREAMAKDTARRQLPGGQEFIVAQESEIMIPAPFMHALGSRNYGTGNVYEMRTYTFAPGHPDGAPCTSTGHPRAASRGRHVVKDCVPGRRTPRPGRYDTVARLVTRDARAADWARLKIK